MASPEAYSERMSIEVRQAADPFVVDGGDQSAYIAGAHFPVHFGGMAAHINNSDPNNNAVVFVEDSADGINWTPVLVSTDTLAGQISITVVSLGQQAILFESNLRYIRFRLGNDCPVGAQIKLHQFVPRSRISAAVY